MPHPIFCPLCSEIQEIPFVFHEELRYSYPGKVYKCNSCEFVFLYPRLTRKEHNSYYEGTYRKEYQDSEVEERFLTDQGEALIRLEKILDSSSKEKSLLEIGCGSGAFLSLANRYFNKVVGVELDVNTKNFLKHKGLDVRPSLEKLGDCKFDLIVMFHVLEHLLDPVVFLRDMKNYLSNTGMIIVEVPNIDDALVSFYNINEFKSFYFCSAHVSYFSPKTLEDCIKKSGLCVDIAFKQRYDLTNHLNWLICRKPGTLPPSKQIFSPDTLKSYEADLIALGLSDTLWAVVKKNK